MYIYYRYMVNREDMSKLAKHIEDWANCGICLANNNMEGYVERAGYECGECGSELSYEIGKEIIQMHNVRCPECDDVTKHVVLVVNDN
jgi:DNA-directed RNA polymerase subunit RPC12/RpoP